MTQRELLERIARGNSDLFIELQQELIALVGRQELTGSRRIHSRAKSNDPELDEIIWQARELAGLLHRRMAKKASAKEEGA